MGLEKSVGLDGAIGTPAEMESSSGAEKIQLAVIINRIKIFGLIAALK